jgi:16S rRNA U516 pseudouridylate synthase RsuA-like enzyme
MLIYNVFMTDLPLLKALVMAGLGSRRVMADAIKQERVKVNGNLALGFNQPVNIDHDQITLDGHPVGVRSAPRPIQGAGDLPRGTFGQG